MHEYVAATRHTLPDFSPRLAFGCRFGAVRQKLIARNFTAACLRLTLRRGQAETHCPEFHRVLPSVVAPARPGRNSLSGISTRPCFVAWNCRGYPSYVARFFTAACLRLSHRRSHSQTQTHSPSFPSLAYRLRKTKVLKFSTHLLTVLIMSAIVRLEQGKRNGSRSSEVSWFVRAEPCSIGQCSAGQSSGERDSYR